ncbi:uncharacterized protein PGTG_11770 [Puccinia graminis f. sp. tritici CRL 75-36-700-3]|uniref:Uncharacterized protein n=1 Tax=Puccinia graminis f. sp. tritici (strain CRL 75-36-700-3 / race SCCL) TaxID=418459 RepID=E3KM89_PUCGT|nr:uncharacterized protein PGTG_11770 [Puccinia graminis f. sp. tritici CRL 75-36-700-3]EFP85414.2 hypothetical protein PGTG_11770 [Puccinia graminis f. sp. tritici CRL 75-36-700-3]
MYIYHALNILTLSPKEKCNNKGTAPVPAAELTPALKNYKSYLFNHLVYTVSNTDQTKPASVKSYSEAISASEGTRSEPSKQLKTTPKRPKKQFKSPEVVPSEWDRDSDSSAKKDGPQANTAPVTKLAKTVSKTNKTAHSAKNEKSELKKNTHPDGATHEGADKKKTTRSNDPLPNVDPFKSKEKVSKLIDKDSISHLTFKKVDQPPQNDIGTACPSEPITKDTSDQATRIVKLPASGNSVSEAAKTLLNGPTTFNQPVDRSKQKNLDSYFVPQGRTVRSISSRSSDHPCGSTTSDSVLPSDGSDLDIITGATAQLWSKPKTLPAPLEEDILLRYPPAHHPLLQAVKLNREYYRKAERKKDESMKVVALRAAAGLQKDLSVSIDPEEFQKIFNWNPKSEFEEYLNTQKGRNFLKERGAEVTPTPPPEVHMRPPEADQSQIQPHEHRTEYQPQPPMYYHPNGYYYPYPPEMYNQQNPSWNQTSYYYNNQNYPVAQQQPIQENLHPQAPQQPPGSSNQKNLNDQAPKSNRNRPRNRKAKGPNWVPPPTLKRAPRDSWEANAREKRRRSHQLSIHQEMIRLNRTTQAQFQALEALRNQNAGGENRRQPREGAPTPKN